MITVNIHKAKTELSRLLKRVAEGEEIVIARAGKPVARLTNVVGALPANRLGLDQNDWKVPEDFNDSLPEALVKAFWTDEA
jgi:prevent-host-death family protein